MKRKAEPASVEEEEKNPTTGELFLKPGETASITSSPDQFQRRRQWRKSDLDFRSGSASKFLGSMLEVISQANPAKEGEMFTFWAGEHEDNLDVWEECEKSGYKYRAFYFADKVINGESQTYVDREMLISQEADLNCEDPEITIAQRIYSGRGNIELKAHQLCFKGRLDLDRPYIFPRLGDEIPGVGCPDLHCTFRGIRDWNTAVKTVAKYASCDRNVNIEITRTDIDSRKKIVFDIENDRIIGPEVKPRLGIEISCSDFKPVFEGSINPEKEWSKGYPSPPSKKRKTDAASADSKTIGLKLLGMGPITDGALRADLNITLVLKD